MNLVVYCCAPKALYNHVGVGGGGGLSSTTTSVLHPLGWCDGCHRTTTPVRSPHTSYWIRCNMSTERVSPHSTRTGSSRPLCSTRQLTGTPLCSTSSRYECIWKLQSPLSMNSVETTSPVTSDPSSSQLGVEIKRMALQRGQLTVTSLTIGAYRNNGRHCWEDIQKKCSKFITDATLQSIQTLCNHFQFLTTQKGRIEASFMLQLR